MVFQFLCCKSIRIVAKTKRVDKKVTEMVIDQKKKLLYEGMKPKSKNKKKLSYRKKYISGLGGSRTRDAYDRSLQTRRDAPVSIATRCIVGWSCSVYVRTYYNIKPAGYWLSQNWIYPPPTSVTIMICPVWYLLYFIPPTP